MLGSPSTPLLDLLWAVFASLCIIVEAATLGFVLTELPSYIFPKKRRSKKLKPKRSAAFRLISFLIGMAVLAQFFFALSLTSITSNAHVIVLVIAIMLCTAIVKHRFRQHSLVRYWTAFLLHYKAILFSKSSLITIWPWLFLPLAWFITRTYDALIPHYNTRALSLHLLEARLWLEQGGQTYDPLHPTSAFASIWEALYFHLYGLLSVAPNHAIARMRTQLASQLTHFWLGQCLCILILSRWIFRILRTRQSAWSSPHALSLFLAWIICANTSLPQSATQAQMEWGALALVLAALHVLVYSPRIGWATYLATSGFLMQPSFWPMSIGFCISIVAIIYRANKNIFRILIAILWAPTSASALVLYRNFHFSGKVFYPWTEIKNPNWILHEYWTSTSALPSSAISIPLGLKILFFFGILAIPFFIFRELKALPFKRLKRTQFRKTIFVLFSLATLLGVVLQRRFGFDYFGRSAIPLFIVAAGSSIVVLQYTIAYFFENRFKTVEFKIFWNCIALLTVAIPLHIFWQSRGDAKNNSDYIARYHHDMDVKNWLLLNIPQKEKVLWNQDRDFFYTEQRSASLSESSIASAIMNQSDASPLQKAAEACRMGFHFFAWTEPDPSSPSATFATSAFVNFLKLQKTLFVGRDTAVFDLRPFCDYTHNAKTL